MSWSKIYLIRAIPYNATKFRIFAVEANTGSFNRMSSSWVQIANNEMSMKLEFDFVKA